MTTVLVEDAFTQPDVEEQLVSHWEFIKRSGLRSLVVGTSKDPNAKISILLVSPQSGRPVLVLKAPTTDAAARAVEAERQALTDMWALLPSGVRETVPKVVDVVSFEGRRAVVMTAVPGTPMITSYYGWRHTARITRVAADLAALDRWLSDFQYETSQADAPMSLDEGVTARLDSRFAGDPELEADVDCLSGIYARLEGSSVPRTAVHGDLWFGNVLATGPRISGVVDWEAGAASGEPTRDLVRFANSYAFYLDRGTPPGRRVPGHRGLRAGSAGTALAFALNGTGWFPELYQGFLQDGLARLGASTDSWRDISLAGIAEVAALTDDDDYARVHLDLFRRLAPRSRKDLP